MSPARPDATPAVKPIEVTPELCRHCGVHRYRSGRVVRVQLHPTASGRPRLLLNVRQERDELPCCTM
jgi:hypothetical protein